MNNRSFYIIIAALCLVDMLLIMRPSPDVTAVLRSIICGGALYYVMRHFRQPNVTMFLFLAVAVLYNPVIRMHLEPVAWLIADVVTMSLFYLLARMTPLHESGIKKDTDGEKDRM